MSGIAFTFRRWRVRHSYPKPIFELALRLMPIHGVAATSRLLDIPMSAIYRWRTKNRDCTPLSANAAMPRLLQRSSRTVARISPRQVRTCDERPGARTDDAAERVSTHASLSNGLSGNAENVALLRILRNCAERRSDFESIPRAQGILERRRIAMFSICARSGSGRGVRRRMEVCGEVLDTQYFLDIDCRTLAETAQMSRHHFIRMFGDLFGISPYQYLMRAWRRRNDCCSLQRADRSDRHRRRRRSGRN